MTTNVSFKYMKPWILANLGAGLTPALLGEPGIGKTAFLENLANDLKTKVFVLSVNQLAAKEDLTGARLVPTSNKSDYEQKFYPHQVIGRAITYAKDHPDETPILFMDEFNRTESDVTSALFTMITERRIGNRLLPENLRLCVAGNDAGNVQAVDDASTTRLIIYHVKPDLDTLLSAVKFNYYVNDVLVSNPDLPLVEHEKDTIQAPSNDDDDDDDYDDDEPNKANSNFFDMLSQDQQSFKQMTTPRTIEAVSKQLDQMDITGQNPANDAAILKDYANDMDSFKAMFYGITGNTKFTNTLIERLTNVFSSQVIKPTVHSQAAPAMSKLPNNIDQLFGDLQGVDASDMEDALNNKSREDLVTIFHVLVSPKVAPELISHNINMQLQQIVLSTLLHMASENGHQDLLKDLQNAMRSYIIDGFSSASNYEFGLLPSDNTLKVFYNAIMGM